MKRWICIIMTLVLMAGGSVSTDMVFAAGLTTDRFDKAADITSNNTFPTIDDGTVALREDASKDATVLIFGQTICSNTELLLQGISKSGWIHDPNVKVIFAEISNANLPVTKHFVNRYGCEEMTACYSVTGGISNVMWEYLGVCGSVSLPVVVLLDKKGNVQEVINGCYSANDLYQAIKKFADIKGSESDAKLDQGRTLSVNGEESYEEAEKVFRLVNQARALEGAEAVKLDRELTETAMIRAAEASLYYAHVRPCGEDCFTIFRSSSKKGENLAVGSKNAQDVMDGWMKSEGHHANIVNSEFTSIGIGCFTDNNGTKYWAQCFDNGKAEEVTKYGVQQVQRSIPILESHIHLEALGSVITISCADNRENLKLCIRNKNEMWEESTPEIQSSDLTYSSSDMQIAEVDDNGIVTLKDAGSVVITAALKETSDINVKINITKQAHAYVRVSGTEGEKYVCENCGGVQGDESGASIGNAEISSNISVTKDTSTIHVVDGKTKKPIPLACVWVNSEQWTDKNGNVVLNGTGLTSIQVEKEGYHKKTVKKKLVRGEPLVIALIPDTGELEVIAASLNLSGEDRDILDSTVSLFDKDLDGESNVTDADFTLRVESAGKPAKYELLQKGRVIQTSADGIFALHGHYSNSKKGTVSYFADDLSAGYEVTVRIFDNKGKYISQKLGIKVSKASSSVFKTIKQIEEESDSKGKVAFGDKMAITIPDNIPIMGGTELEFGFEDKLPISVSMDVDTGLVRIALNMGEFDTGDSEKWIKKKQEFNRLKQKAKSAVLYGSLFGGTPESFGAGMFSVTGGIMGYGEGYLLDNSDSLCINLGVVVSIQAEKTHTHYYFLPGVLVPVKVSFGGGISCDVSGEANLQIADSKMMVNGGTLEFEPSIYVKPEMGVGIDNVISYSACGKIDVTWLYRYLDQYSLVTLNGKATLKQNILWGTDEWDLWNGTKVLYDSNNKKSAAYLDQGIEPVGDNLDLSGLKPISMEYLSKREDAADNVGSSHVPAAKAGSADSVCILDYAYENASPRLIKSGNKLYLFYLDGVAGRSEFDQTALFYRISSDNGITWSKALRVDNGANETADYNFDVAVNENEIYVIWSDSGKVYGNELMDLDSSEAIAKTGKELDLALAAIDASTGTVRETSVIKTDDADMQPKVAVGIDGTVYTAWITNDVSAAEGLLSNQNKMCICYTSSKDNYTVHKIPLPAGFYPLGLDLGLLGEDICIALSLDTDADLGTQEDREIYTVNLNEEGTLSANTENHMIDAVPVFGEAEGKNCLFWYQDGNIAYTADDGQINLVFDSDNLPSMGQEFTVLNGRNGAASIVWASTSPTEEAGVDVYGADFNGSCWSEVYRFGSLDSEYTGTLSGYLEESGHRMAYLGSMYENGQLHSHIGMYTPGERVETSITWYAENDGIMGEAYPLRLSVTNTGNKIIDSLVISSEDGSIQDTVTGLSIAPGTSFEFAWDKIVLPSDMKQAYSAKLSVIAKGETDSSDNLIDLSVGEADFSVEAYLDFSGGDQFAGIVVTNNGIAPSDAALAVYKDEAHTELLYQTELPEIAGGESRMTLLDLTVLDKKAEMFYITVSDINEKEIYTDDNETCLYVGKGTYLEYGEETPEKPGTEELGTEEPSEKPPANHETEANKPGNTVKTPSASTTKKPSVTIVKKPSVPTVKSFKAIAGKKKLTLSWKKLSGISGYQVQISTKKNFKGAKKIAISKSKKSYTKKNLKAKKKYYIRIRAYKIYKNAKGKNVKAYGNWKMSSRKTK